MEHTRVTAKQEIQRLTSKGDDSVTEGSFTRAVDLYKRALDICYDLNLSDYDEQTAKIHAKKSLANIKICKYKEAVLDATLAMDIWPSWYQGYNRASQALECLEDYVDSLRLNCMALERIYKHGVPDSCDLEGIRDDVFVSGCSLVCRVRSINQQLSQEYFNQLLDLYTIQPMIALIASRDRYDILLDFLKMGLDETLKSSIKQVFYCPLIDKWHPSQEQAVISGLQTGLLHIQDLDNKEQGIPPLHMSVFRGKESGSTKLLEYLLKNHYTTRKQVELLDGVGGGILHYLCVISIRKPNIPGTTRVVKCLKSFDHVDFLMTDVIGRTIHQIQYFVENAAWLLELCKTPRTHREQKTDTKKADREQKADTKKADDAQKADTKKADDAQKADAKKADDAQKADTKKADDAQKADTKKADDAQKADIAARASINRQEALIEQDLRERNQKLEAEIFEVKKKIKDMKEQYKSDIDSESTNGDYRKVKCTVCDSVEKLKLEVPLSQLPEVLEKLGVIELLS